MKMSDLRPIRAWSRGGIIGIGLDGLPSTRRCPARNDYLCWKNGLFML
jgi:hypothetical protein